jgi:hypothetical protein
MNVLNENVVIVLKICHHRSDKEYYSAKLILSRCLRIRFCPKMSSEMIFFFFNLQFPITTKLASAAATELALAAAIMLASATAAVTKLACFSSCSCHKACSLAAAAVTKLACFRSSSGHKVACFSSSCHKAYLLQQHLSQGLLACSSSYRKACFLYQQVAAAALQRASPQCTTAAPRSSCS